MFSKYDDTTPAAASLPRVELRHFEYLAVVMECGSITSAANKLGISQPTLSEAITRIERELGIQLVVRTARGVDMTEAGALLARNGREISDLATSTLEQVLRLGKEMAGTVSIAFPPALANLIAVPLAETIRHEYSDIRLYVTEALSQNILEMVRAGEIDYGISFVPCQRNSGLHARAFYEEKLYLVAATDDWDVPADENGFAAQPTTFDRLAELPLLLPKSTNIWRQLIEREARALGFRLSPALEIDSLSSIVSLMIRASAYGVATHSAVYRHVRDKQLMLVPITGVDLTLVGYLVRRADEAVSQRMQIVEKQLAQILAELVARYGIDAKLHFK